MYVLFANLELTENDDMEFSLSHFVRPAEVSRGGVGDSWLHGTAAGGWAETQQSTEWARYTFASGGLPA